MLIKNTEEIMKKALSAATILSIGLLTLLSTNYSARASSEYLDGKLLINGFVKETVFSRTTMQQSEQKYRNTSVDSAMTSALFEMLYTVRECPDSTFRLFSGFKWWWEKAPRFDGALGRYMPRRDVKNWMHPRSFEDDMISEMYADYIRGPWEVRVGKQIVIWGQLDMQRVADVVNPLDVRKQAPGIDTWEEVKQGLWMIRTFYMSQLPGNLLFETIFNPGDYENVKVPFEGAHYGPKIKDVHPFDPGPDYGIYYWQRSKWDRDAPGWNLKKNWEFGFRVRGNTLGVDWTLLYWNARSDGPVANPWKIGAYSFEYIKAGLLSQITGNGRNPQPWEGGKVYYFKRYQTIGGEGQYYSKKLWDTVWRTEWFYEIGSPMNKSETGKADDTLYDWTRRDVLGVALQCNKSLFIPGFTNSKIATDRMLDVSLTYFWEKIFNHDRTLIVDDRKHARTDSVTDALILFVKQDLFHSKFVFVFTGNYYIKPGQWMAVPTFSYVFPGTHWRADLGYVAYGGAKRKWVSRSSATKDSAIFRLRYEF
jgi:hypothetical protein